MVTYEGQHVHGSCVHFPRSAQLGLEFVFLEIWGRQDLARMNRDARVLVRVFSILGREGDFLGSHGLSGVYVTVLEDYGCISKYEVYCSIYVTFTIELAVRVYVQRVLVT